MHYELSERHNRTLVQCIIDGKRETIVTIGPAYTKRVNGQNVKRLHTQIHNLPGPKIPELAELIASIKAQIAENAEKAKEESNGAGKPAE